MPKIITTTCFRADEVDYRPGLVLEVSEATAADYVRAGLATLLEEPAEAPSQEPPIAAALEPERTAVLPRPRKAKR